ncbi:MAG: SDR family oxidoreductase [Beijerinckiaceae bacterium]|nr:SDR family oxidoreductase [Beijerinckiaceae bacterium]
MTSTMKTVLVLGANGMLGSAVLRYFAARNVNRVVGSVRSPSGVRMLPVDVQSRIVTGIDVENFDSLTQLFATTKPDVVINCIGLVKQLEQVNDPLVAIPINALLPHRLARLSALANARLVHISTDCVFAGTKGAYTESDASDAKDLYGRSKFLGEVDYPNAITLRTSIIGHELNSANGLIGWFLAQQGSVKGFSKAVFSGFPTVEMAEIIHDVVIPRADMRGL